MEGIVEAIEQLIDIKIDLHCEYEHKGIMVYTASLEAVRAALKKELAKLCKE